MVEATETETIEETTEESWLDAHDLSDEDRETLSKYETHEEALKGSANAIRQVGKSVRFPDEETSDEDKTKFNERIAAYQGVPDKPENYKLERPKELPEGMVWDEGMEQWFREKTFNAKTPQSIAQQMFNDYCEMKVSQFNAYQKVAKGAEEELRKELGNDFEVWFGNPKDKESIGTIKQTVNALSKALDLDYGKDAQGVPQSKLADCLELERKNGCLGDMVPILKVLNFVHTHFFAEGASVSGDFVSVKDQAAGDDFWKFKDMDGKQEGDAFGEG